MGKIRRKHNWKGRQHSDPQEPSENEKTDVVVEIRGRNKNLKFGIPLIYLLFGVGFEPANILKMTAG